MTNITIIGNSCDDPEHRVTKNGTDYTNFTVAVTSRKYDKQTNQWTDDNTTFYRCVVFGNTVENIVNQVKKGTKLIVTGSLTNQVYEKQDGSKGTSLEVKVQNVGVVIKPAYNNSQQQSGWNQPTSNDNPWAGGNQQQNPPF